MARNAPSARHAIDIVEAAYSIEGTEEAWLESVLAALTRDADFGQGAYLFTGKLTGGRIDIGTFSQRDVDPRFLAAIGELNRDIPEDSATALERTALVVGGFVDHYGEHHPSTSAFRAAGASSGIAGALALFTQDAQGSIFSATALAPARVHVPARIRAIWRRIGIHVVSAVRLRQRLRSHASPPDALVDPGGKMHHAEPSLADDRSGRERLEAATRAMDRARTAKVRATPERAFELWQGLVDGRWSLVDHWENDGRRWVAAFENRPKVPDPRALTPQERIVLRHVSLGSSNKEIAFGLGVPHDSVETAVSRILRKLRCRRRSELIALGDVGRWTTTALDLDGASIDMITIDPGANDALLASLTKAERDVATRVIAGDTNQAIAAKRGSSEHTVANQLRSIYAKLGLTSRAELVRALTDPKPAAPPRSRA